MGSPWCRLLFKPSEAVTVIMQDDESPVLVLVPVLAGISIVFAWIASSHGLFALATQVAIALLLGPPLVLLSSWWGRLCITGVCRLLRGRLARGTLISIIAWSWLPLLYLSLISVIFSRLDKGGNVLIILQMIGIVWQMVIAGVALRRILDFSPARTVSLVFLSLMLYLLTASAAGYALASLTSDWFKVAGVL